MARFRTVFLGTIVGGLLSAVMAPRLARLRRGPLGAFDRRVLTAFGGTPCSQELKPPDDTLIQDGRPAAHRPGRVGRGRGV